MIRRVLAVLGVAWLAAARPLGAQGVACESGGTEVRALEFTGNETFTDAELANRIATTASSWSRRYLRLFGERYCLDSLTVSRDSLRLLLFYNGHGFTDVKVGRSIRMLDSTAAAVRFDIAEGRPLVIDSLTYSGLDEVPDKERILRGLPLRVGERFDRFLVEATRDTLVRRLRDRGYPGAEVLRSFDTDTARRTAALEFSAATGVRQRVGEVSIQIEAQPGKPLGVRPERVLAVVGLQRGELFSQSNLEAVKRGLYLTEAFQHVDVSVDSASLADASDSLLTVRVTLTEAKLRAARVSAGWATFDCFRTQLQYTDYNFLHGLRRVDVTGRLSKISNGAPLDFGNNLCSQSVRRDRFSDTLNYYAGATISQAALFGQRILPSLSLYSERRSELSVFLRDVPVGLLGSLQYEGPGRIPLAFSYQLEYGRTVAQPAYFCQVFQICEVETQRFLLDRRRSAVFGVSAVRNRSNDPINPSHGSAARLELRNGSQVIGSDPLTQFTRAVMDASLYRTVFDGGVLVLRLRAGAVLGRKVDLQGRPRFIPPQERMYAGGPNTVRGFRQNEMGSLIYLVTGFDTIPNPDDPTTVFYRAKSAVTGLDRDPLSGGGDNVVVGNVELRVRSFFLPELVQYALFADAGELWNRGGRESGGGFQSLKVTPGVGLRVFTAIGPVRVDVGYNPYDRPAGPAYFNTRSSGSENELRPVYCVSPDNRLPVPAIAIGVPVQQAGTCPATFDPAPRRGFFNRLTFNFSIGQAF